MAGTPPLAELILSLEQATLMAKQLPATANQTRRLQIFSSLHQAHNSLSSFLSSAVPSKDSSTVEDNGAEPMHVSEDDDMKAEPEENSKAAIEKVEEKMRKCYIKNKRRKRGLSPSAVEERRMWDDGYDPYGEKLRALELVYQFHA